LATYERESEHPLQLAKPTHSKWRGKLEEVLLTGTKLFGKLRKEVYMEKEGRRNHIPERSAQWLLKRMVGEGLVYQPGHGLYAIKGYERGYPSMGYQISIESRNLDFYLRRGWRFVSDVDGKHVVVESVWDLEQERIAEAVRAAVEKQYPRKLNPKLYPNYPSGRLIPWIDSVFRRSTFSSLTKIGTTTAFCGGKGCSSEI
jgi:hypothetical protein